MIFILFQKILPKHLLSRTLARLAHCRLGIFKNTAIRLFIQYFKVDLSESQVADIQQFSSFNEFFIRHLKPRARPMPANAAAIACPADGRISEIGKIQLGKLLQAKNKYYTLLELLGGDHQLEQIFKEGHFATIYLAPKDYHRVHMPIMGRLQQMIYIPGKLFSVNSQSVNGIPGVFSQNERVVCIFSTDKGPMAVILVGALLIGGVVTSWEGQVMPTRNRKIAQKKYENPITLLRGDEIGYFQWGSTAIVLFAKDCVDWCDLKSGDPVKMGQTIGFYQTINSATMEKPELHQYE